MIGVDQHARRPCGNASARYGSQFGCVAMSSTTTARLWNAAVPHEPTAGPIATPSSAFT